MSVVVRAGALLAVLLATPAAQACSWLRQVVFTPPEGEGTPRARNAGVLATVFDSTQPRFEVSGPDGAGSVQVLPLVSFDPDDRLFLLRLPQPAPPGTRQTFHGELDRGGGPARWSVAVDYGAEVDTTPPAMLGAPAVWIAQRQVAGRLCPSGPQYTLSLDWPAASEVGFVSVIETTAEGAVIGGLSDMAVGTQPHAAWRVAVPGTPGRRVCFRYKVTDLALNESPLSPVCCADEARVTGPCQRVEAPPPWFNDPAGGAGDDGGGCTVGGGGRAGGVLVLLPLLVGALLRRGRGRSGVQE